MLHGIGTTPDDFKDKERLIVGLFDSFGRASQTKSQQKVNDAKGTAIAEELSSLTERRDHALQELGAQYVDLFGSMPAQELKALTEVVLKLNEQIHECEKRQRLLKGLVLCERCGAEQSKDAAFCSRCGNRLVPEDVLQCPRCRTILPEGTAFCTNCGAKIRLDPYV